MRGIALEGCASRSAWQVGVVVRLAERGLVFDAAAGASSGSLVAVAVATGRLGELEDAWLDVTARRRPVEPGALLRGRWPGRMSHVLRDAAERWLGDLRLPDVPRPLGIPVTLLGPGGRTRVLLDRSRDLPVVDAILASCFIPGPYSRMPRVDGRPAVDGAWQIRVPAADVLALGASRVLALTTDPGGRSSAGLIRPRHVPWPAGTEVLAPSRPVLLGSFDFDATRTRAAIAQGREDADRWLASRSSGA